MSYFEIEIKAPRENFESINSILYIFGVQTILEEETFLKFYMPKEDWGLIENLHEELTKKKLIKKGDYKISRFEDKNWNDEWEKSITPVYIDDKIVIHSSFNKHEVRNPEGKILIEIDPKMSFGTGHNETTQLMLEMMSRYMDGEEKTLLDYGCGTAILAIAGIKLGIGKAIAIEIDPEAIENAHEYVEINNVSDRVTFYTSNISEIKESGFDVICANIVRSVIQENVSHIKEKLAPDGKLFVSGVLLGEEKTMTGTLLEHGFRIKKILHQAEWLGIYATA